MTVRFSGCVDAAKMLRCPTQSTMLWLHAVRCPTEACPELSSVMHIGLHWAHIVDDHNVA